MIFYNLLCCKADVSCLYTNRAPLVSYLQYGNVILPDSQVDAVKKEFRNSVTVIIRKVSIMHIHPEYET